MFFLICPSNLSFLSNFCVWKRRVLEVCFLWEVLVEVYWWWKLLDSLDGLLELFCEDQLKIGEVLIEVGDFLVDSMFELFVCFDVLDTSVVVSQVDALGQSRDRWSSRRHVSFVKAELAWTHSELRKRCVKASHSPCMDIDTLREPVVPPARVSFHRGFSQILGNYPSDSFLFFLFLIIFLNSGNWIKFRRLCLPLLWFPHCSPAFVDLMLQLGLSLLLCLLLFLLFIPEGFIGIVLISHLGWLVLYELGWHKFRRLSSLTNF